MLPLQPHFALSSRRKTGKTPRSDDLSASYPFKHGPFQPRCHRDHALHMRWRCITIHAQADVIHLASLPALMLRALARGCNIDLLCQQPYTGIGQIGAITHHEEDLH
jgi:hypothetical protein